tara:strand:- start:97 stop:3357 length:3261 start_codon:yes stop_codon:yes gene_type:complete
MENSGKNIEYSELICRSNFSFLKSGSSPEEIIERAKYLGYKSIAITDEVSVAGLVRAYKTAKQNNIKLIYGSQFWIREKKSSLFFNLVLLVKNKIGWQELCKLITKARGRSEKNFYHLTTKSIRPKDVENCFALLLLPSSPSLELKKLQNILHWLKNSFQCRALAYSNNLEARTPICQRKLLEFSNENDIRVTATSNVCISQKSLKPLLDVLTSIRLGIPLHRCGYRISKNSEQYLREKKTLSNLYLDTFLRNSICIENECNFSLDEITYKYPANLAPKNVNNGQWLKYLVKKGLKKRMGINNQEKVPIRIFRQISNELKIISKMKYECYFLTVYDIVAFARSRNILCQGRGSAANSAVCYYLGITEVDPAKSNMLFARFLSEERNEPPDIDIDFEHKKREQVIQYIYKRYGLTRAALTASTITYKKKSAIRDVGKSLEIPADLIEKFSLSFYWEKEKFIKSKNIKIFIQNNFSQIVRFFKGYSEYEIFVKIYWWIKISNQILGFPRHLSQHVGGFIISSTPLHNIVPIENAKMENRTVIQWNKYDIEELNILKIDILGLGMLSAIQNSLAFLEEKNRLCKDSKKNSSYTLQNIPKDDSSTYEMIAKADTVGVFQVESRAQMAMLIKLKPACFYDLVIEVAIVRPGPIKGGMIHPYLERRQGKLSYSYPSNAIKKILDRTLGVPIFQEQVMELAIEAADFSPGEADQLRRSLSTWKDKKGLDIFHKRILKGMEIKGYSNEFAERVFSQIHGFGEYGFPESHAASFALLVYFSAWIKKHHPDVFLASLLNAQPLGFYQTDQLIRDARDHKVVVLSIDVQRSAFATTLEYKSIVENKDLPIFPVRLGLNQIKNISQKKLEKIEVMREKQGYVSITDLCTRVGLNKKELEILGSVGALQSFDKNRFHATWSAIGTTQYPGILSQTTIMEESLKKNQLGSPNNLGKMVLDYSGLGFSLNSHPASFIRPLLHGMSISEIKKTSSKKLLKTSGLITNRQRPQTARGTVFITIEDETGSLNLIISNNLVEKNKEVILRAIFVSVEGYWEKVEKVESIFFYNCYGNFIVSSIKNRTELLTKFFNISSWRTRDFH